MLDFGWQELMVVAFVLVLVVGPKDLPRVLRSLSKFLGKARSMAQEFQSSLMEVADQEEFRSVKQALRDASSGNFDEVKEIKESMNTIASTEKDLKNLAKPKSKRKKSPTKKKRKA